MLLLVTAMVTFLIVSALRGWKGVQKGKLQLDTALDNMAVGLCMFDADQRLVTVNRRFADIFSIPTDKVAPGMSMRHVMEMAQAVDKDPETAQATQQNLMSNPSGGSAVTTLADGRVVSITHRPVTNGGFVATFEDITERRRAEETIHHLAHHDGLTDLPNRLLFHDCMKSILSRLGHS